MKAAMLAEQNKVKKKKEEETMVVPDTYLTDRPSKFVPDTTPQVS